tara:strand:+ start:330 stop:926 length:597 start_codon:yes stop_codon:yes gene_type:complete
MILKGESAEEFNRKADENYEKFKARQKQNLIDMMEADEKLGLYENPQQEKGEFQRGVDSVKQELHEQRDWCECGNCEPIFKGGKMCKNSKWAIYYPYKPQPTEDVRRLKSIEVKIDTLMYDLMTIIERTESKDCAEPTDQQTTEKIYTIEDIEALALKEYPVDEPMGKNDELYSRSINQSRALQRQAFINGYQLAKKK